MGEHDEIHVAIVDDNGDITGSSGNIIEKWTNLSKALQMLRFLLLPLFTIRTMLHSSLSISLWFAHTGTGTKFTSMGGYTVDSTGGWGLKRTIYNFQRNRF